MTYTDVRYKDRSGIFEDVDFLLLLCLVIMEVEADRPGFGPLADRIQALDRYFTDWSPGEVCPDLQECLSDRSSEASFLAALEAVKGKLAAAGSTVPSVFVEAFRRKQRYGWQPQSPYPAKPLVIALEDLRLLIEGPEDLFQQQLDRMG